MALELEESERDSMSPPAQEEEPEDSEMLEVESGDDEFDSSADNFEGRSHGKNDNQGSGIDVAKYQKMLLDKSPACKLVKKTKQPQLRALSDVWKHFMLISVNGRVVEDIAACSKCKKILLTKGAKGRSFGTGGAYSRLKQGCSS